MRKDLYNQSKVRKNKKKNNNKENVVPSLNLRKIKKKKNKKNLKNLYDNYDINDIIKETEAEDFSERFSVSHKK